MQQDETKREEEVAIESQGNDTYLVEALKKAKENSVSKEEYEKLLAQNKAITEAYIEGKNIDLGIEQKPTLRKSEEIREELFGKEHNNLEGWKLTLELREAVLSESGKDIFVGEGHEYSPTENDFEKAQNVADVVQECIERSNGSSEDFTAFLMSKTNDVKLPQRKR